MMRAAEDHRAALAEWRVLVGDIPIDWAFEHAGEIRAAGRPAARHHRRCATRWRSPCPRSRRRPPSWPTPSSQRLHTLKSIGAGGESFPMLLDDAAVRRRPLDKPHLLELLVKASADQQIIYLTEDEDVAAWARVEAMTGAWPSSSRRRPAGRSWPERRDRQHRRLTPTRTAATGIRASRDRLPSGCAAGHVRVTAVDIRLARLDDAEALRQIYNHEVSSSTVTFDLVPRTPTTR